jgi:hypothetical protein
LGGLIGVMSPKFVVHAGVLLLSARIGMHALPAVLDPSTPITTISADLARSVDVPPREADQVEVARDRAIGIDRSAFRLRQVRVSARTDGASLIIGSDLLESKPVMLDFGRNRLTVVEETDRGLLQGDVLANATRGLTAVPLTASQGGCPSITGEGATGQRIVMALVGSSSGLDRWSTKVRVKLGPATFQGQASEAAARCRVDAVLHWEDFGRRRVLIDLPHHELWLSTL